MIKSTLSILIAILGSTLAGCSGKQDVSEAPRPALVIEVKPSPEAGQMVFAGDVRARYEADLAFRIAGKLVARQVDVGSTVKAGDVLARLDPADSALNAEAVRAQAAASEADYRYAKAELDRFVSLREKSFISQAAYDARQNAFNAAKARFEQTSSQAKLAGNQAAYTVLRADHAGIITAITAEPGQVVGAGQVVMKLARPEEKEVVVAVAENRASELRRARAITIRLWANPGKTYRGKVREIAPNADATTRTFAVKVSLLDADSEVRLGMTANVLLMGAVAPSLLLPLSAITQKDGQTVVWVVEGTENKVMPRPVKIGEYGDNGVPVLSGLSSGERVVVAGVHKLLSGQVVRPLLQTPPSTKP